MEVTTMAVFTSPTAFKKDLKYLVKISLENNTLVLLVKSLAIKKGVEYGGRIRKFSSTPLTSKQNVLSYKNADGVLSSPCQVGEQATKFVNGLPNYHRRFKFYGIRASTKNLKLIQISVTLTSRLRTEVNFLKIL